MREMIIVLMLVTLAMCVGTPLPDVSFLPDEKTRSTYPLWYRSVGHGSPSSGNMVYYTPRILPVEASEQFQRRAVLLPPGRFNNYLVWYLPQSDVSGDHVNRLFLPSVGDVISAMPFLPLEVNVPDMISAMMSFMSRVPIINRWQQSSEPRIQLLAKLFSQYHLNKSHTSNRDVDYDDELVLLYP